MIYTLLFWAFFGITAGAAIFTGFTRNIVYAAFALFVALCGVAALYVLAGSDFLAGAQVVVYVGGVLILILFGVMLSARISSGMPRTGIINLGQGALASLLLLGLLVAAISQAAWPGTVRPHIPEGNLKTMGVQLMTQYVLPFEAISILLLLALVGAAWLSRRPGRA